METFETTENDFGVRLMNELSISQNEKKKSCVNGPE